MDQESNFSPLCFSTPGLHVQAPEVPNVPKESKKVCAREKVLFVSRLQPLPHERTLPSVLSHPDSSHRPMSALQPVLSLTYTHQEPLPLELPSVAFVHPSVIPQGTVWIFFTRLLASFFPVNSNHQLPLARRLCGKASLTNPPLPSPGQAGGVCDALPGLMSNAHPLLTQGVEGKKGLPT